MADAPSEPPGCTVQHGRRESPEVFGGYQVPQLPGLREFTICDQRAALAFPPQTRARMTQIVEAIEQHPRSESRLLAHQFTCLRDSAPNRCVPVALGPYRHDSRRRIPTPEPFVFQPAQTNGRRQWWVGPC